MDGRVDRGGGGERGRHGQPVAHVPHPGPADRGVDGQQQRLVASRAGPLQQVLATARSFHTYNWNHLPAYGAAAATSSIEAVPMVDSENVTPARCAARAAASRPRDASSG